ncbi:MAG TPA: response regulator transcription factor [Solirubrobacteraceae bacterium]|nr:response regulator transcription factor [Solirubrobacteraceae bacterium]
MSDQRTTDERHRAREVFILDEHVIFRRGMETCLASLPGVSRVTGAGEPAEAWATAALGSADLVIADSSNTDGREFIRRVREVLEVPVVACSASCDEESVLAAVEAGAIGLLAKETICPENLRTTVEAALGGAGVMSPEILAVLLAGINRVSRETLAPRGLSLSRLTARERQILRLIAEGRATREVALELSYSERTVKNVVHDIVTKLGARSRAHAVAYAVRERLI